MARRKKGISLFSVVVFLMVGYAGYMFATYHYPKAKKSVESWYAKAERRWGKQ